MLFFFSYSRGWNVCSAPSIDVGGRYFKRVELFGVISGYFFFYASSKICGIAMTVKGFKSLLKTFKPLNADV